MLKALGKGVCPVGAESNTYAFGGSNGGFRGAAAHRLLKAGNRLIQTDVAPLRLHVCWIFGQPHRTFNLEGALGD